MKQLLSTFPLALLCLLLINCKSEPEEGTSDSEPVDEWQTLFNGKDLTGWDTYLGMPFEEGMNIWQQREFKNYKALGLNNDPLKVFSVVTIDGQPAMRISGEVYGGISTVDAFEDYHLQLEFKWGELKYAPRLDAPMDSGILYHGNGEHGSALGFWLHAQEFQVQEHDCGDYWGVAGSQMDIRSEMRSDSAYQYKQDGELRHFGNMSDLGQNAKKFPDNENAKGEWNTLDLYTYGNKSAHVVNGVLTMVLENSRIVIDSIEQPLTKGKIQFQTEGAELYYRNIKMKSISAFPSL